MKLKYSFTLLARISFAATVILIPFRLRTILLARPNPSVYGEYTDFLLYASDVAMLVTLIFWLFALLIERKKISLGPGHVWIAMLGLTVIGWLSIINSLDAELTAYHALRFSLLFLFFLYIVNEIRSARWVVIALGIQIAIQAAVAIPQSLFQDDMGLQILGEYVLDPAVPGTSVLESGSIRFLRAYGLSDHPNILGGCLAVGLLVLLVAFIHSPGHSYSVVIACIFTAGTLALLLTFSRSAWLALFAGALLIMLGEFSQRNLDGLKRTVVLTLICLVVSAWFLARDLPYFAGRFNTGNSFSTNRVEHGSIKERAFLFATASHIVLLRPFTGVGLGVSVVAMKEAYPVFPMSYQPPHIALLLSALETGVAGAGFHLALMIFPLITFAWQRKSFLQSPLLCGSLAVVLALVLIGLFDHYPWMIVPGRLLQWLVWGLWAVCVDIQQSPRGQ